ncbi:Holliday junction resolvase [Aeropyrum pernix]|uniref:Crossover junction endodeoxyribonuclease Hjc n=2 Tax=Aeropyrum pernix TaxID=56636 RepID=A0A401H8Z8_AERPX|nr:Holliday junction resolvase [Aeropyrum pernix]
MDMPRRGVGYERELAKILWDRGWAVIRGPASGGGSRSRVQPDLVAVRGGVVLVFEIKKARGETVYLDPGQVLGLLEWARRAGGDAWIALRLVGKGWRFHRADSLEHTRRGGFKISRPGGGLKLRDLLTLYAGGVRRIDSYLEG